MTLLEILRRARGELQVDVLRDRDGILKAISQFEPSAAERKRLASRVNMAFDTGAIRELAGATDRNAAVQRAADIMSAGAMQAGTSLPKSVVQDTVGAFCTAAWQPIPESRPKPQPRPAPQQPKPAPQPQPAPRQKPQPKPAGTVENTSSSFQPPHAPTPQPTPRSRTRPGTPNAPAPQPAPQSAPAPANVRRYVSARTDILQDIFNDVENGVQVRPRVGSDRFWSTVFLAGFLVAQIVAVYFVIDLIHIGAWESQEAALARLSIHSIRVRLVFWLVLMAIQAVIFSVYICESIMGRILLPLVIMAVYLFVPDLLTDLMPSMNFLIALMLAYFVVLGLGTDILVYKHRIKQEA